MFQNIDVFNLLILFIFTLSQLLRKTFCIEMQLFLLLLDMILKYLIHVEFDLGEINFIRWLYFGQDWLN